jgi:hypothetical protein
MLASQNRCPTENNEHFFMSKVTLYADSQKKQDGWRRLACM